MNSEPQYLHVVFLPCPIYGHLIPTLHIAKLFAAHNNVKVTIITTPQNIAFFNESIIVKLEAPIINIVVLGSPPQLSQPQSEQGEKLELVQGSLMISKHLEEEQLLQRLQLQLEQYLEDNRPDCLVADTFFPWTMALAAKFNIPRLVFHGSSSFALCAMEIVRLHKPYTNVSSDTETFVLPALPHEIHFTRLQIPQGLLQTKGETEYKSMKQIMRESDLESYGVIVNSFYELEPDYADIYKKQLGMKRTWNIGPVSLSIRKNEKKSQSSNQASINEHVCLQWLASKKPNSVIYLCFGSATSFIAPQLHEIAIALEASEQDFIWVVRNNGDEKSKEWLPTGFEQRMENKGIILMEWAPQVLILEHEAIGAFVTHCGWNSTIEGISAGVPMVTWPVFAEQFYNEKLVTQILKTGVPVGAKKWSKAPSTDEMVTHDLIEKALWEIMVGSEANERRTRAKKLKEMAEKAVEKGGSSHSDLSALINELRNMQL